jgi:hypothetical protein
MTPTRSSAGSAPRTLRKPKAKLRAAVKSSPTGPREARREAVPLDGRAQRSYPNNHRPHSPKRWVENCGRSITKSETPQPPTPEVRRNIQARKTHVKPVVRKWALPGIRSTR